MNNNRPLRVFLCHSKNDAKIVRDLYEKLRAEPWISPWLDEEELYPGQDWETEIEKAVELSDVVLVCLSNGSINKRGYVQKELRFALDVALEMPEETIFIVPLRLEECTPPRSLRDWQYADYFEGQRERGLQRLLVSLERRAESLGLMNKDTQPQSESFYDKAIKHKELVEWFDSLEKESNSKPADNDLNKITLPNGMEFMRVPAGKFIMGSDNRDDNEKPQHTVDIPYDFWMARFPVTNEFYNAYAISKGIRHPVDGWKKKKDHPIVRVKWKEAMAYCRWLNNLIGNKIPPGLEIRLPTEAEWEKAARGTDGREYPWGNDPDSGKFNARSNLADLAGILFKSMGNYSSSVAKYSPNGDTPYGCADILGNVWEWTHSLYRKYPYDINDGREKETELGYHVLRGGSYINLWKDIRCSVRTEEMSMRQVDLGFRVCIAPSLSK